MAQSCNNFQFTNTTQPIKTQNNSVFRIQPREKKNMSMIPKFSLATAMIAGKIIYLLSLQYNKSCMVQNNTFIFTR